jgi:sigma-E factor negative regulatory protein RseB
VRRLVAASGPLAILGPLALLSVVLLPGSVPVTASLPADLPASLPTTLTPTADPGALALLEKASHAPRYVTYRGVQFVSAWTAEGSNGRVVDVSHEPGQGTTVTTRATPAAAATTTYLKAGDTAPSLLSGTTTLTLLGEHYDLSLAPPSSVAGRRADVVVVSLPGASHATARFWLDHATGLVLRREVYDEAGRVTRASAFVEVDVGAAAVTGGGGGSMGSGDGAHAYAGKGWSRPDAWRTSLDLAALTAMRHKGWSCPQWLDARLQLVDARRGDGDYGDIVHLSYSDGLASVSVFEQRGRLEASRLQGYREVVIRGRAVYARDGVPQRLAWSTGGTVFTVVADATPRTVGDVVVALPHGADDPGALHRLGRGLDRVASWFNPFG